MNKKSLNYIIKILSFSFRLSLFDLVNIYRRSIFGPWWITINATIFVLAISTLWSKILGYTDPTYTKYIACGIIYWWLILETINKSIFFFKGYTMTSSEYKYLFSISRNIFSTTFQHFHIMVFLLIFLIYEGSFLDIKFFFLIFNYFVIIFILLNLTYLIAILTARFHDFGNILKSVMALMFFLTPVIWTVDSNKINPKILLFNPFYHFLEICRYPFMGIEKNIIFNYMIILTATLLLLVINIFVYKKYSHRIYYWVN